MNAAFIEAAQTGHEPTSFNEAGTAAAWFDLVDLPDGGDIDVRGSADVAPESGHRAPRTELPAPVSEDQLAAWMAAIVDRDEGALAALYDATLSRVFGIVQRIVRRAALAEEVVEDAYFQVWRQAARFDPTRGTAIGWLLAIARSRAIDAVRREARFRHEPLDDDEAPAWADAARSSDDLLDVARTHADLQRALLLLGAQPRQLVSLAFFRGLSHEEIASHTCLPRGTVKSQIRRAVLTLRQVLGNGGPAAIAP